MSSLVEKLLLCVAVCGDSSNLQHHPAEATSSRAHMGFDLASHPSPNEKWGLTTERAAARDQGVNHSARVRTSVIHFVSSTFKRTEDVLRPPIRIGWLSAVN